MTGLAGAPPDLSGVAQDDDRTYDALGYEYEPPSRTYYALLFGGGLLVLLLMIIGFGFTAITDVGRDDEPSRAEAQAPRDLPPYWTVRRGDTFSQIAQRTGLEVADLETFNPRVDPAALVPGQRLKLVANPPKPKPKPLGPRFVTVRSGDSFASISAKTGHAIDRLRRLNPKLKPTTLRPGDRVRLR